MVKNIKFSILVALSSILCLPIFCEASVFEPNVLWDHNDIRVCFYDHPSRMKATQYPVENGLIKAGGVEQIPSVISSEEQMFIRNLVNQEYSPEKTGIYFVGWKACSEERSPEVILLKAEPEDPVEAQRLSGTVAISTMGQGGENDRGGIYKSSKKVSVIIFRHILALPTVHEFGHIAGLKHEMAHPRALEDRECVEFFRTEDNRDEANPLATYVRKNEKTKTMKFTANYDRNSAMNTCLIENRLNQDKNILTEMDQRTLRSLYSRK